VFSVEARGAINEKLDIHADLAVSLMDTVWVNWTVDSTQRNATNQPFFRQTKTRTHTKADPVPAFYTRINSRYGLPVQADLAYIPKGFYSPFSFAAPVDGFFPVGSNMVGTGKFIGRGEASPYTQNMAGLFLSVSPPVGYGHLRFSYGQHFQPEKAQDVLYFPYRLNGQDFNSTFQSSYNRWGNSPVTHSLGNPHARGVHRLGDESFVTTEYQNPTGYAGGALRSDYLSIFESFVPYESMAQADSNLNSIPSTNVMTRNPHVPQHQKYSFNLEADGAWDIAPLIGYRHDLFLSGYAALNGVSSTLEAVAFSPKNMMLWGYYLRAEPAIALSEKFYLLGLAGYEVWRSDMAYTDAVATDGSAKAIRAPINYQDWAFGGGLDYDFAARVGFHFRYKWMKHEDKSLPDNTWAAPLVSGEIKMWF
jgi:opacity protein-like surface antigen